MGHSYYSTKNWMALFQNVCSVTTDIRYELRCCEFLQILFVDKVYKNNIKK